MQKLAAKLVQIMKEVAYVEKKGSNEYHKYSYATSADVLQKINAALTKYNICSIALPEVVSIVDVVTVKGNTEHLATVKMDIMLVDADSGEMVTITGLGSGQDSGDKAIMKAETASIKYAYLLSMAISTGDDPESDAKTDESMEKSDTKIQNNKITVTQTKRNNSSQLENYSICSECGISVTPKVIQYSEAKYGKVLCVECQRKAKLVS